ncbi:MAG: M64 family metallo-endopeptidase [Bacteroidetes bacterium]|nr:M64 family metallo-endopeptidase [Bacteroidota bacterium]
MKKNILPGLFLITCTGIFAFSSFAQQGLDTVQSVAAKRIVQVEFDDYFFPNTLRVDYYLAGDFKSESVYLSQVKQEPYYGGSRKHLVDPYNYGTYRVAVFDSVSGNLLFTRGFNSLFQEWQGTPEAHRVQRSFEQTAIVPFPRQTIKFQVEKRRYNDGIFEKLFTMYINPNDYFISRKKIREIPYVKFHDSGDPLNKVDVAFIAEGYTKDQMEKFLKDASRIGNYILSQEPYKEYTDRINLYAIESPSEESGVDVPGRRIYVNTDLNSSFFTFDMDRYLTTSNTKEVYDIAANVPYDVIFILVNSKIYGGGGFYNLFGESTVDNYLSEIVSIHEFGHSFAGLADEYYTSEVTYSDFYNTKVEPWEPNITTNVDFGSKWKTMIRRGTPVPTPRDDKYQKEIGLFEGGGYVSKGVYSPMMDCRMKSNEAAGFCPVCREAIIRMIKFYSE